MLGPQLYLVPEDPPDWLRALFYGINKLKHPSDLRIDHHFKRNLRIGRKKLTYDVLTPYI